jgi:hypothetical protein
MFRTVVFILTLTLAMIQGCNNLVVRNPFPDDPLTGGSEAATSRLLDIPLPLGMERYSTHGYQTYGVHGGREGLETLRGNIDMFSAALSVHSSLAVQGWHLRLSLRKGDRIVQVYERGNALALLNFRRQTVMTILEIWTGGRLVDGAMPNLVDGRDGQPSSDRNSLVPAPGSVEKWGGSSGDSSGRVQGRPL